MERRTFLAAAGLGVSFPVVLWVNNETSNAPAPAIDEELSYDNQLVQDANHYRPQDGIENTAVLLTDPEHIDIDIERALDEESTEFISETDFDEYAAVVAQVSTSSFSTALEVLGVEREDTTTVRVYTWIAEEGGTDDLYPHTQVIRIAHEGQVPDEVAITHFMEESKEEIGRGN